jgi:hypothetical protein
MTTVMMLDLEELRVTMDQMKVLHSSELTVTVLLMVTKEKILLMLLS